MTPEGLEYDPREAAILAAACRQADDIALLERQIAEAGAIVAGSKGQPRLAQAVTEVRQGRLALARLLGDLALPDEGHGTTSASLRGRRAAATRWDRGDRVAQLREERGHGQMG